VLLVSLGAFLFLFVLSSLTLLTCQPVIPSFDGRLQGKMLFSKLLQAALLSCTAVQDVSARVLAGKPQNFIQPYKRGEPLQNIVTWDEHSLLIRGERVMLYSGEFHPVSFPMA
jgi:hypothetical protein